MFDPTSRYYAIHNTHHEASDGRRIIYKKRRFPPAASMLLVHASVLVREGDRLDTITARALGDPLQFWRVADANDAMDPFELMISGTRLNIPSIQFAGRVSS